MVEHVYYILTGRKVLLPPKDLDDPLYAARRRAYQEQRRADRGDRGALREGRLQSEGRLQGLDRLRLLPRRRPGDRRRRSRAPGGAGRHRPGADARPEQVERKVDGRLRRALGPARTTQMAMLYGGIDSKEVTERAADPSGAMGAIQRILANDVACKHTLRDFARTGRRAAAVPGHRARRRARRLARGRRGDPPGDRAPARADPRPRRRRRFRRGRRGRSSCSPASSPTRSEQKGLETREDLLTAGTTSPTPPPIRTTPSAPGAAWSPTCCAGPNSCTSETHRMRRDFLKLCGLAGLGLAVPIRLPAAGPRARRRTTPTTGRTTSCSTPRAAGTRRTSWTPRASTGSTACTRKATSSPQGATSSPRPRSTSRAG